MTNLTHFSQCIYFTPLHVSSNKCSSSGGSNCVNTSSAIIHSSGWLSCVPVGREPPPDGLTRQSPTIVYYTRWCIDTIWSSWWRAFVAWNMWRREINTLRKVCQVDHSLRLLWLWQTKRTGSVHHDSVMLRIKNFHLKQFLGILCEIQIKLYMDTKSVYPYACELVSADELLIIFSWNLI
jgi:hypothetical protein